MSYQNGIFNLMGIILVIVINVELCWQEFLMGRQVIGEENGFLLSSQENILVDRISISFF
jgi:hypothetical protein